MLSSLRVLNHSLDMGLCTVGVPSVSRVWLWTGLLLTRRPRGWVGRSSRWLLWLRASSVWTVRWLGACSTSTDVLLWRCVSPAWRTKQDRDRLMSAASGRLWSCPHVFFGNTGTADPEVEASRCTAWLGRCRPFALLSAEPSPPVFDRPGWTVPMSHCSIQDADAPESRTGVAAWSGRWAGMIGEWPPGSGSPSTLLRLPVPGTSARNRSKRPGHVL